MKKQFIAYSVSTALNRATQFLFLPLATQTLSLGDFGSYSLALGVAQLSFPFFCLNGHAAVTREGAENLEKGLQIVNRFLGITLVLGLVTFFLSFALKSPEWLYYGLILGTFEAIHQLIFSYLRIKDDFRNYFIITFIKAALTGVSLYVFRHHPSPLIMIFQFQCVFFGTLCFWIFPINQFSWFKTIPIRPFLSYCLFLLPSGISQWLMNGSDRFVIKAYLGDEQVGIYSIGYTLALVLMIVNAGLALSIPQLMFRDYKSWLPRRHRALIHLKGMGLNLLIFTGIMFGAWIDLHYFGFIKGFNRSLYPLIGWVSAGLITLVFYYIYSNIIFYYKKTHILTAITVLCALFNIIITIFWVQSEGILGAAKATFVSYLIFVGLTFYFARKVESKLNFPIDELGLWTGAMLYIGSLTYYFSP